MQIVMFKSPSYASLKFAQFLYIYADINYLPRARMREAGLSNRFWCLSSVPGKKIEIYSHKLS